MFYIVFLIICVFCGIISRGGTIAHLGEKEISTLPMLYGLLFYVKPLEE